MLNFLKSLLPGNAEDKDIKAKGSAKKDYKLLDGKRNDAAINLLWAFALYEDNPGRYLKGKILRIVEPEKDIEVDLYNELISIDDESSEKVQRLQDKLKAYLRTIYPLDYKLNEADTRLLWKFVRGDLQTKDFEEWLYSNADLEKNIGADFYFELISVDYKSTREVEKLRDRFQEYLHRTSALECHCITFSDLTIIDAYNKPRTFEALTKVRSCDKPHLSVKLCQCPKCEQYWLKAYFYEHEYFKRLEDLEAQKIIEDNEWPKYFETVEELLIMAKERGVWIYYGDSDPALPYIIAEIAKGSPGITLSKLSSLLRLGSKATANLSKEAVAEYGVDITFH